MKHFIEISLLFCGILLFFNCDNTTGNEDASVDKKAIQKSIDYEGMAQDLCKCMTPLMDIQQKIAQLSAEGRTEEIQELLSSIEKMSEDGDKCVEELEAKYGVIETENEQKANAAFQKACPKVAQMLKEAVE